MGRKPLANAVKEQRGSFIRHAGRRNTKEPKAKRAAPKQPRTVTGDKVALATWKRACSLLDELGVLTTADEMVLESFCLNESALRVAAEQMDKDKDCKRTPASMGQWNRCLDRRVKLLAELGLTPSSRSRLVANCDPDKDDPLADFYKAIGANS